ncbi:MAG: hemolysin family protein [Planctomycetaceae bacterium]
MFVTLPWTIARVGGEGFLYRSWPVVSLLCRLSSPIWRAALHLDRIMHRVAGLPEPDSHEAANLLTEELRSVVDESQREGVIESNASSMIHRVVDLYNEDVAAIMTPRTDMITISAATTLRQALPEMIDNGFSRVPVIRDGIDDIVGILYARDLLASLSETDRDVRAERTVGEIAREVLYAPESQGIGDLLEAMRHQKVHMAIVVDEYSGVSGLVTLEDILEEIVGDIADEYDEKEGALVVSHGEGLTEVDARYHLDDLNDEFGYGFPEDEEFDTIGGFALSCFGRIPSAGDEHQWNGLKLVVTEADERRIIKLRIEGEGRSRSNGNGAEETAEQS